MNKRALQLLAQYQSRWKMLIAMEYLAYALAGGMLLFALLNTVAGIQQPLAGLLAAIVALGAGLWLYLQNPFVRRGREALVRLLHRQFPALEQSVDLLLLPDTRLSSLGSMQREIVAERLVQLPAPVRLRHQIPRALALLLICGLLSALILNYFPEPPVQSATQMSSSIEKEQSHTVDSVQLRPATLQSLSIKVAPPPYTRLKAGITIDRDLEVPWGSTVDWTVTFDQGVDSVSLHLYGEAPIFFSTLKNDRHLAKAKIVQNGFYYIRYKTKGTESKSTDYYKIEVIEDQPPAAELRQINSFTSFTLDSLRDITIDVGLRDDYGLTNAYLIATLSRGQGESVKFREDTLRFDQTLPGQARQFKTSYRLSPRQLQMQPGDELYVHLEAVDNRQPDPQLSKTHKYIIAIEDTTTVVRSAFGTLAVNRMPEYFRSQRQIIIDTEKLMARRGRIEESQFQSTSNNIGIDQKLLRLRYGQFLGEEYETVIGQTDASPAETNEDHDHPGHDHDHESEADSGSASTSNDEDTLLEGYAHFHDRTEQATLFDESTGAKLRAALAEMWNAELHLRMGRPEEALPYEYKALKLIKAIQQASRIYVARVGFEPPLINVAQDRYSGELGDIQNVRQQKDYAAPESLAAIRRAFPLLEQLMDKNRLPTHQEKQRLRKAAEELAALTLQQPGPYLKALQQLRIVADDSPPAVLRGRYYQHIRSVFWSLIPARTAPSVISVEQSGRLSTQFLNELAKE